MKKVTLTNGGENIKKFLRDLARKILLVGGMAVITFGLSELAFHRIEKIEEQNCWQVLEDSAQAVNREISIRFEDNINTLRLVSQTMEQEKIVSSYAEMVNHINTFYDKTIFKRIYVLYPDNTLLLQTGATMDMSNQMDFATLSSKGEYISERMTDILDESRQVVHCYVPITTKKKTEAILVGVIDCKQLSTIFKTKAYDGDVSICMVDRSEGAFIMDDWRNEFGNMYEMEQEQVQKEYEHVNLVEDVKNAKTGEMAYVSDENGNPFYMYYTPVGMFDWQLLFIVEDEVAFSSLIEMERILRVVAFIELVLLIVYFGNFLANANHLKKSKLETERQLTISNTLIECIATLSHDTDMDNAINKVLQIATEYFKGERAYLFEIDYERQTTSNTYEYAVEGVTKEIGNLQDVPISAIANWIKKFQETGMFCISDLDKDIEKDTNTYSILQAQNIHKLIAVPLEKEKEIIGFFGVDNPTVNCENLSLISSTASFLLNSLEKRQYQDGLERLSYEDALTKLYNRNKFNECIDYLKENQPQNIGVAYIDLNGLKVMNDKFGHKAGDELIKKAAQNIASVFGNKVYRIGGDEFVIIVFDMKQDVFAYKMEQVTSYMKRDNVSISVGISWEDRNANILAQIHEADERMYANKKKYYENSAVDRRRMNK